MTSAIFATAAADYRQMRREYQDYLIAHEQDAEEATNGWLLNARGKAAGIDPSCLFSCGPLSARAYASAELVDFWRGTPRLTLPAYEAQWVEQATEPQEPADVVELDWDEDVEARWGAAA